MCRSPFLREARWPLSSRPLCWTAHRQEKLSDKRCFMSSNFDLLARRMAAVPRGVSTATPVFAARAENAEIWDVEGKRYIDFAGGIAVLNTGHRHPKIMAAVARQLELYTHTAFQVMAYEPYIKLAERLNAIAPFKGSAKTILFTTGAEAVENSLKALHFIFKADVEPARVAAIIIEPVQGEGGFHAAPPELLKALRNICNENDILLIADEIQSGFARTGKMFAIEHSGVEPDLVTIAKSLAGGFPLSGVIGRATIMDAAEPGGLGGTYAGSPVACAAALAVLDVISEEKLLARADAIGEKLKVRLRAIASRNDTVPIAQIRGLGAMVAFDIVKSRGLHDPDGDTVKRVTARALENGLVLLSCGIYGETIRILVPLTASDAIVEDGLDRLEISLVA